MRNSAWNDLVALIEGKQPDHQPVGFIIDSPWIPGWYGISKVDYYSSDDLWFRSNLKAADTFPDAWFMPGFWSEYGMCTEPSAFGSRMINERFIKEGIRIDGVIAIGGVAKKNPFVMQIVADVLNVPIKVASSDQTCALGSAMAASVVAGVHKDIPSAQKAMGGGFEKEYQPDPARAKKYEILFRKYKELGNFIERSKL